MAHVSAASRNLRNREVLGDRFICAKFTGDLFRLVRFQPGHIPVKAAAPPRSGPQTGPGLPDLSSHVASAGSAMRWLNSSRAPRLRDRLASSAFTGSISPAANLL